MDILSEIEAYPWRNPKWHPLKLEASSPFRDGDNSPSFSVNLDPSSDKFGWWNDWGAVERRWRAGPPEKLISYLRNITEEEALELLYGNSGADSGEYITVRLQHDNAKKRFKPLDITLLDEYSTQSSDYLTNRGISPETQRLFQTGYDPRTKAVTIPWIGGSGQLLSVKYRSTYDKRFWYIKNGVPIRDILYGMNIVYDQNIKRVAIVEAELDALTLYEMGIPAIATGGATFNNAKRDLILRSPIEEVVLVRDNDLAGRRWRRQVYEHLRGKVSVSIALVPRGYKDVNESRNEGLGRARNIGVFYQLLA